MGKELPPANYGVWSGTRIKSLFRGQKLLWRVELAERAPYSNAEFVILWSNMSVHSTLSPSFLYPLLRLACNLMTCSVIPGFLLISSKNSIHLIKSLHIYFCFVRGFSECLDLHRWLDNGKGMVLFHTQVFS